MTVLIFALLGGVVFGALLGGFDGFVLGGVVGALAGWVADLAGRVRMLERRLEARKTTEARAVTEAKRGAPVAPPPAPVPNARSEDAELSPVDAAAAPSARPAQQPETEPLPPQPTPEMPEAGPAPARAPRPRKELEPSVVDVWLARAGRWFTTGNIPVKVGVVLSLLGVGFLVKEGIDRQLLVLPLEVRLMLVAAFGVGLLVLGWRLRTRQRSYALPVQGGGIGVLYLTTYASFALYGLLPASLTFALLVIVTAAAAVLAVLQDARSLAVLGALGGFLAPVLASTGSGNHVALFSYYAVLDLAILGIAWFKAWRMLNVLGFLFTFGIATLWGLDAYRPELFATTEPFLVLFTALYLVIPVLFALRVGPQLRGFVDGTLTFGTPVVAFTLQSRLVADTEYGLALSAVVLALAYVAMATFLYRRRPETLRVLVEAQLALGTAFVTLAVPLALDARWTSAAWALEGAALVWLAFRQQRKLALLAGLALQGLAGIEYLDHTWGPVAWPVVNGRTLGALLLALAAFFSARLLDPTRPNRAAHPSLPDWAAKLLSILLLTWATGWWFFGGFSEIVRAAASDVEFATMLGFAAVTTVLSMRLAERVAWPRLDWAGVALWPIAAFFALVSPFGFDHPAENFGWLAWPAVVGAMLWFLLDRERAQRFPRLAGALHVAGYWLAAGLAAWEAYWLVDRAADGVWPDAAALAFAALLALATLRACARAVWPFGAHAKAYRYAGVGAVVAFATFATLLLNVSSPGNAAPLGYVPLLNPLELASALVVFALLEWLGALGRQNPRLALGANWRGAVAAVAAWFLITMTVARAVHHWAGIAYDLESLAASTTFQSALSIVWGVSGLAAMLVGARTLRRVVWLAGAVLMTVVVAKLFLVDLGNTGTLARVVSFLGVGALLLVVGYFAPVPPRANAEAPAVGR